MSADLRELLELASDDLRAPDLAEDAWARARAADRAVRRRSLLAAGGAVAAGAVATALVRRDTASGPSTAATPTVSATRAGGLDEVRIGRLRAALAPSPSALASFPRFPDADDIGFPEQLGPGDPDRRGALAATGRRGTDESIRAVFLVGDGAGFLPVLLVPGVGPPLVTVPAMRLEPLGDPRGATGPVIGPRTISDDRHRVVVAQTGRVVVVDARGVGVLSIPVPDDGLVHAGWAKDGRTVIARSAKAAWLVDVPSRKVARAPVPARPDWSDLVVEGSGIVQRSFSAAGLFTDTHEVGRLPASPYGEGVANTEGWVGTGVSIEGWLASSVQRRQGLLAVQGDIRPRPRVLAAPQTPDVPEQPYRPLGWGPRDHLLFVARTAGGVGPQERLLAWDVTEARLYRVADVEAARPRVDGAFTGRYAI